ncbi:MAG: polyprenyl synthetase family protein [Wenzhouxiangella sp.]
MSLQANALHRPGPGAGALPAPAPADALTLLDRVECRMQDLVSGNPSSAAQQAALDHLQAGGGRFRARLAIEAGLALDVQPAAIVASAASVELVHNASLVHDDVQDRDRLRRGRPAVWAAHGEAVAICTGDLLLSAAYAALATSPATSALAPHLHNHVTLLIRGQDADLGEGRNVADLASYEAIAAGKSGPLLSLPLSFALHLAGHAEFDPLAKDCGRLFSLGYQMFDDLRDLEADRARNALNAVRVVEAAGQTEPASIVAKRAGKHFGQTAALARTLPCNSGRLLAETALKLHAALPCKENA